MTLKIAFIFTVLLLNNEVFCNYVNVALLVTAENDIDSVVLKNSVEWTQKFVLSGYGTTMNVLKVVVDTKNILGDSNIFNKNLSISSFILEPYFTNEYTCILSDLLNIPLISVSDINPKNCRNILSMRPDISFLLNVLGGLLEGEGILNIGIIVEEELISVITNFMSKTNINTRVYFNIIGTVLTFEKHSLKHIFEKVVDGNHKNIMLLMRTYYPEKFIRNFNENFPDHQVKWYLPFLNNLLIRSLTSLTNAVGLAIPIQYDKLEKVRNDVKNMKTRNENESNYLNIDPLIHDAIVLIAETIKLAPVRVNKIYNTQGKCLLENRRDRIKLTHLMKDISFQGLTGLVYFTTNSHRFVQNLAVREINLKLGFLESGKWIAECNTFRWNDESFATTNRRKCESTPRREMLANRIRKKHLKIVTIPEAPLIYFDASKGKGNDRFSGFCKDLLERISSELGFTYEFYLEPSQPPSYGSCEQLEETKPCHWSGLIGQVLYKHADIGLGSITITSEREDIVDFSKSFMDFTMTLIMQQEIEHEFDIFAFLEPFEPRVWLSIISVLLLVTIILYFIDRMSPYGCRYLSKDEKNEFTGKDFKFYNCLWFMIASLFQQGPNCTPKSLAARMLLATFWLFTLIIISTYTANLAALFTTSQPNTGVKSLEDLVKLDEIEYGILEKGQTYNFFKNSNIGLYKHMFNFMKMRNAFATSTSEGIARVRKGGYAYLSEDPIVFYKHQRKPCNTDVIKNLLEAKSYGIVLQKQSEWTNPMSVVILRLREQGFIEQLRAKWWDEASECGIDGENNGQPISLKISSLAGLYIIMSIGIVLSIIFLIIEIRYQKLLVGGRCFQQEQNFNNTRNINHEMRFVEPSQSEDSIMNKLQQQMCGSNERLHKILTNIYSPRDSPTQFDHKYGNPDKYQYVPESTL